MSAYENAIGNQCCTFQNCLIDFFSGCVNVGVSASVDYGLSSAFTDITSTFSSSGALMTNVGIRFVAYGAGYLGGEVVKSGLRGRCKKDAKELYDSAARFFSCCPSTKRRSQYRKLGP